MSKDLREHLFTYDFEGGKAGFGIMAASAEEAERRVRALVTATYDGELVERVDAVRRETRKFIDDALSRKG
ncbi:MAG: hypothetical protein DI565_00640 [Ancylobacter novellus]|uniref:Uncharacterized protein n=1 Tax=Ancylobacter novellus TaxID=921 RepID=A0A2W5KPF1_ANCNO|nr:MAG: hypothetical protein DI565_00640 [Ancylobacter novellus]